MSRSVSIRGISLDKWRKLSSSAEEEILPLLKFAAGAPTKSKEAAISRVVEHRLFQIASQMGVVQQKVLAQELSRRKHLQAAMEESDRRFKIAEEARRKDEEERLARLREKQEQLEQERKRREEERRLRSEADEARRIEMSKEVSQRLEAQYDPEKEKQMQELDAKEREQKDKLLEDYRKLAEEKKRSREEQNKKAKEQRESLLSSAGQSSWKDDDAVDFDDGGGIHEDTSWGSAPVSIKDMLEKETGSIFVTQETTEPTIAEQQEPITHDLGIYDLEATWEPANDDTTARDLLLGDDSIIVEEVKEALNRSDSRLPELKQVQKKPGRHRSVADQYDSLAGGASLKQYSINTWVTKLSPDDDVVHVLNTATYNLGPYHFFTELTKVKKQLTDAQFSALIHLITTEQANKNLWITAANEVFEYITTLANRDGFEAFPLSLVALFKFVVGAPDLGRRYWERIKDIEPPQNVLLAAVEAISSANRPQKFLHKRSGRNAPSNISKSPSPSLSKPANDLTTLAKDIFSTYIVNDMTAEVDIADSTTRSKKSKTQMIRHITQLTETTTNLMRSFIRHSRFTEVDELWKAVREQIGDRIRTEYLRRFVKDPDADPHEAKYQVMAIPEERRDDAAVTLVIRAFAEKGDAHSAEEMYELRKNKASDYNKLLFLTEMVTAYEKQAVTGQTRKEQCEQFIDGWTSLSERIEAIRANQPTKTSFVSKPLMGFYEKSIIAFTRFYVGPMDEGHDESCIIPNRKLLELSDSIRDAGGYVPGLEKRPSEKLCIRLLDLYIKSIDEDRANLLMGCLDIQNTSNPTHNVAITNRLRILWTDKHQRYNPHLRRQRQKAAAEEEIEPPTPPDDIPTPVSA